MSTGHPTRSGSALSPGGWPAGAGVGRRYSHGFAPSATTSRRRELRLTSL